MALPVLTKEQRAVVDEDAGAYLVIAPPGSGKTTVLTERVLRFAADGNAFRVLALTFTNKAATNIIARLNESSGADLQRVTAQTVHAFCHDLLRHYGNLIDLEDFTIYDKENDRLSVLREGLEREKLPFPNEDGPLKDLLDSIGRLKRDLLPPSEAPKSVERAGVALDAAYDAYDSMLRKNGALDFDDLLFYAYRLLATESQVSEIYRTLYRYAMIDEAQDTSLAQYEILRAIFCDSTHGNLMMVADADQSIFQFAGAKVEYLLRFEDDFQAQRRALTQNFRCAGAIVDVANNLIAHNPNRLTTDASMTSAVLAPGLVMAASYETPEDEATAAVELALSLAIDGLPTAALYEDEDRQVTPEQICVLGRSRYLLASTIAELERRSVAFQFSGSSRDLGVFESKSFATIDAAIRWRINPSDSLAKRTLARSLGTQPQSWARASSLADVEQGMPSELRDVLAPLRVSTDGEAVGRFVLAVEDLVANYPASDAQAVLANDLTLLRSRWDRIKDANDPDALARLQSEIALLGTAKISGPGIRVLTIHAAKGLEFRAVILVGMNDGSFPDFRSLTGDALVEERRNAYVAFTRAERVLAIKRFRSRRTQYGTMKSQTESRFIAEAAIEMQRI